jgi:hypothetical protein
MVAAGRAPPSTPTSSVLSRAPLVGEKSVPIGSDAALVSPLLLWLDEDRGE